MSQQDKNQAQIDIDAISYLRLAVNRGKLRPFLKDNDKTPVWDGDIFIFGDKNHTAADVRKIPVQVKGKTTNGDISKSTIKHTISKEELQNFSNDGGVVFFVILMKDKQYKIYYKTLLPQDIKPILIQFKSGQKEKSIELRAIDEKDIYTTLNHFWTNRNLNRPIYSFDVLNKTNQFLIKTLVKSDELSPNPTLRQMDKIMNDINTYIYAVPQDYPNELLPIARASNCQVFTWRDLYKELTLSSGKTYEVKGTEFCNKQGTEIYIGAHINPQERSVVIHHNDKSPQLSSINIAIKGTLNQRLIDIEFVIELFESSMGDKKKGFEELFKYLKGLRKLFNDIGLKDDIDISKLTSDDYQLLKIVKRGFNGEITLNNDSYFQFVKFSDYNCLVHISKEADGKHKIENPYTSPFLIKSVEIGSDGKEGESAILPMFYAQVKQLFYKYSNTDYEAIYSALITAEVTSFFNKYALNTQLKMIEAFDDGRADSEVLELALKYGEWLKENAKVDIDCLMINRIQILKRMGNIQATDYAELGILTKSEYDSLRFAAFVLLNDKQKADIELANMNSEQCAELETYPIYTLYKKLK